ncbi:MAG: hypothetical protein JSV84_08200 [Gemmatimonadota bacterium]|nr:MAG: hypothetical protein JSV84_08200 [Gemmatimonadota bacterium]
MFLNIYLKEFARNLKGISFYLFTIILFVCTYFFAANLNPNSYIMGLSIAKEWHNAPILIAKMMARFSAVGLLLTIIMVGRSVTRDFSARIHDFFFTLPMKKTTYLGGRFFGGLTANVLLFLGVVLGFIVGCLVIGTNYYGPFRLSAFLLPLFALVIPNLLLVGGVFFSLATLTRKMTTTYLAGIGLLMVYGLVHGGFAGWENDAAKSLLDPFGIATLDALTKYWTVADINTNLMPLGGTMLWNRILWFSVSLVVLIFTWRRFRFVTVLEGKKKKMNFVEDHETKGISALGALSPTTIDETFVFHLRQSIHLISREFRRTVFHPAFLILTFMAISEILTNFGLNVKPMGDNVYPVTSRFLSETLHLWIYIIPLTIFFGGVIIWRERDHGSNEFYDTLPLPNSLSFLSKLLTMMAIQFCYIILAMIFAILTQIIVFRYTNIEVGLYIRHLFGITLLQFWFFTVFVFFIQNLSPNKILGFFLCALYFVADLMIFVVLKFDLPLLRYGNVPGFIYSNLNGFGHYGPVILWYTIYWLLFAAILVILTSLLWRRNNEISLKFRLRVGLQRFHRRFHWALVILFLLFLGTGGHIAYNRYILNEYRSERTAKRIQADYEKKYSRYKNRPQPNISEVKVKVDLYPEKRAVHIGGQYTLVNKTKSDIDEIIVSLSDWHTSEISQFDLSTPSSLEIHDSESGFRLFKLNHPLTAGQEIRLDFDFRTETRGFTDNNPKNELAAKGTCIILTGQNHNYFPRIGYNSEYELSSSRDRKKFGLSERPSSPTLQEANRSVPFWPCDLVTYEAIISTTSPQTVVSNGDLVRRWSEKGRNFFHYRSEAPMNREFVFASSEYDTVRDTYENIGIEVYFDKQHPYNAHRMIKGVKRAFDYCTKNYCPYPYRSVRIVEVPRYVDYGARSNPTVFTWSEDAGFISNLEKPGDVDMVFAICTHEMAHQWWAYIVTPADAEGDEMLTETMAQYIETMCLEKVYGKEIARKFLKKEMSHYLSRRKRDIEGERPLMRSYSKQYYINYPKSSVTMYALQDYVGEDRVNRALKTIVDEYGHREDRFPLSVDLIDAFKDAAPDSFDYLVTDLFETITLWENKAESATYEELDNDRYRVHLNVSTHKFRADSMGTQTEIPINDYIDIGLLGENNEELYSKKHRFEKNTSTIEIIVDKKPIRAGIDPYVILIDREREDNVVDVRLKYGD